MNAIFWVCVVLLMCIRISRLVSWDWIAIYSAPFWGKSTSPLLRDRSLSPVYLFSLHWCANWSSSCPYCQPQSQLSATKKKFL